MTHADWIGSRRPEAPERLVARVREVLGANPVWDAVPVAEALLGAGEALLGVVLQGGSGVARDSALDLLAADACVTWAFEAAADEPEALGERAREARRRIAEVAA
jgi:hypothetical protein